MYYKLLGLINQMYMYVLSHESFYLLHQREMVIKMQLDIGNEPTLSLQCVIKLYTFMRVYSCTGGLKTEPSVCVCVCVSFVYWH